ncbi:hypothetical protein [Brevibacterium litoralis]|uniref:hypothetical protein n=1 Tax=Brevibacterium litoralis TaxID=3138935 RepID=UPI0032EE522F
MRPSELPSLAAPAGTSPVFFPVGATSQNEAAILGKEGYMFVYRGSNGALNQYAFFQKHPDKCRKIVDGWTARFHERKQKLATRGIRFGASSTNIDAADPDKLSWWLNSAFTEIRFVWSADFDWDMVDDYRPEVVIGQGLERFLLRIPEA